MLAIFYAPECGFEFDKALLASSSELLVKLEGLSFRFVDAEAD